MTADEIARELRDGSRYSYDQLREIPVGAGIYAAWWRECRGLQDECLYVGIAYVSLGGRVGTHFGGGRGGDQFSLYVWDEYGSGMTIPAIDPEARGKERTLAFNNATRAWARANVCFSAVQVAVTREDLRKLEEEMKGVLNPTLNRRAGQLTESGADPETQGAD